MVGVGVGVVVVVVVAVVVVVVAVVVNRGLHVSAGQVHGRGPVREARCPSGVA